MTTKNLLRCALFAALTAAGAFVRIPLAFSTVTLQFLFTALAGVLLGAGWGALSQGIYVGLGLVGLPIFAAGGGLSYLLHPSCGFVLALPLTAFVIAKVCKGSRRPRRVIPACLAGLGVLYVVGLAYMGLILNVYFDYRLGAWALAMAGMIPYLPGDGLKIALCALVCMRIPNLDAARR